MTMHAIRGAQRRILFSLSSLLTLGLAACEPPPTPPHPDPTPGLRHTPPMDPYNTDEFADNDTCECDEVEVSPVCGDDGITYSSACAAGCAGVEVVDDGACELDLNCESDADCDPLEYCRRDGACGSEGTCAIKPDVCDVQGEEVCGCDGETYENSCMAGTVGVSVAHPGPCGCLCELIYDPVCGDDGETYANSCLAECAGAAVDHDGTCSGQCSFDGECGDGEFCDHSGACDGDTDPGHCAVKPMLCTGEVDEVCGCDGVTYGNACEANAEGMGVAAEGPCDVMEDDEDVIIND